MKSRWTVLVDTREKLPLLFPQNMVCLSENGLGRTSSTVRLHTIKRTMKTGDYALSGHESEVLVERKGSVREVAKNCLSKDRSRFLKALDRLADETKTPYLLMEGTPLLLQTSPGLTLEEPSMAVDSLLRALAERDIRLLLLPSNTVAQRRATGQLLARLLIAHVLHSGKPH